MTACSAWEAVVFHLAGVKLSAYADPSGDLNLNLKLNLARKKAGKEITADANIPDSAECRGSRA